MKEKIAIAATLITVSFIGVTLTMANTNSNNNFLLRANALSHDVHEGNHYLERAATTTESGCKEYWVCCGCSEHYLEKPTSGNWTEAGTAFIEVDSNDSRYIAPIKGEGEDQPVDTGTYLSDLGFQFTDDGQGHYTITSFDGSSDSIILPDGVVGFAGGGVFKSHPVYWIVIPESVTELNPQIFKNNQGINTILYFVGERIGNNKTYGAMEVYDYQGVNWDYDENNVPHPITK